MQLSPKTSRDDIVYKMATICMDRLSTNINRPCTHANVCCLTPHCAKVSELTSTGDSSTLGKGGQGALVPCTRPSALPDQIQAVKQSHVLSCTVRQLSVDSCPTA